MSRVSRLLFRLQTLGVVSLLLAAAAVPWFLSILDLASGARDALVRRLGLGTGLIAVGMASAGALLVRRRLFTSRLQVRLWLAAGSAAVLLLGFLSLLHPGWTAGSVDFRTVGAGGVTGERLTGSPVGVIVWLASAAVAFTLLWPRTAVRAARRLPRGAERAFEALLSLPVGEYLSRFGRLLKLRRAGAQSSISVRREAPVIHLETQEPGDRATSEVAAPAEEDRVEEAPVVKPAERAVQMPLEMAQPAPRRTSADGWQLPALDLLQAGAEQQVGKVDNQVRAALIVDTLASFGVDARVVQISEGPTVTQFGIEPGWEIKNRTVLERDGQGKPILDRDGRPKTRVEEVSRTRVRVNQITNLASDLALALAAPSIRIEAPVPGRSVIGIEVPNATASVVTLRSVIESPAFQRAGQRSRLTLALGKSVSGEAVVADLAKMPHLLIAGATGSGKSVCINAIIACLLMHASPEEVRLVMIDPKRVELTPFARIPHLAFSRVIVDLDEVVGTLQAVIHEMESRYRRFAAYAVRNIEGYNRHPQVTEKLPYWVVIIDELADLMMAAPFEVEKQLCRLAQLARATGIHLVVATQRPSVDVVTGLIKANFPTRIAFAMTSHVDSRTILDGAGAEKLLGRGDMLFMATDAAKPKRLQGVYVSDAEIDRIVSFWCDERFGDLRPPTHDTLIEEAMAGQQSEQGAPEDPLLAKARELAGMHRTISASLLERRLGIGHTRAARLLDMLEEEGVVGPYTGGGGPRQVLLVADDGEDGT